MGDMADWQVDNMMEPWDGMSEEPYDAAMAPIIVSCPYCGADALCVDSKEVYRKSYGPIYLCRPCWAYVGCHPGTTNPLGRLADAQLRGWKKNVHRLFDPLWKEGPMKRKQAYKWLAKKMGIPFSECHIGMFDVERCKLASELCKAKLHEEGLR